MGDFATAYYSYWFEKGMEEGIAKGMEIGRAESTLLCIKNLMKNMKLTAQQAMDALKIPDEERTHYMEMLK